jgi:hypothetical protein
MKEATFTNRSTPVQLVPPGALVLLLLAGCASTEIAVPGSDTVRITRVARDVAGCTAVGNVKAYLGTGEKVMVGDEVKFRNQVIGFGGNVGFVTLDGAYTTPAEGVAYRCPASP